MSIYGSIPRNLVKILVTVGIFVFFSMFLTAAAGATTIYASPAGDDSFGDGSIINPYKSLNKAHNVAAAFDVIQLDYGTYSFAATGDEFPLLMKNNITIRGMGFAESIVSGDGLNMVFSISGKTGVVFEDITITGGGGLGGGVTYTTSSGRVSRCRITGNYGGFGGGISVAAFCPSVQIDNCIIDNNLADNNGGGICIEFGSLAKVINCTVYGNQVLQPYNPSGFIHGSGVFNGSLTSPIFNTIIWANRYLDPFVGMENYYSPTGLAPAYSIIESYVGSGIFTSDPNLIAPGAGDFRPNLTSIFAVDTGGINYMGAGAMPYDINGSFRPITVWWDGINDIGAYEVGDSAAPTGSVVIDGGAVSTNANLATLTLDAVDTGGSGLFRTRISNNGSDWAAWRDYAATYTDWDLENTLYGGTTADGVKTVYVQYKDHAGNISDIYTDTIIHNPAPPTGSISINAGDVYATGTPVTLTLTSAGHPDGVNVTDMVISDDGIFDTETWIGSFSASYAWTLPAGDGVKTVYVRYRDEFGIESVAYEDSIILDSTAPTTASISIFGGAVYTSSNTVTLTVSADDPDAYGIADVRFSNDGAAWSDWETYTGTLGNPMEKTNWLLSGPEGVNTAYVEFRDPAGNSDSGSRAMDSITYDISPPIGTITIGGGAAMTNNPIAGLSISASDNLSGVVDMKLTNDVLTWPGSWQAFSSSVSSWDLTANSPGDGSKTVYVVLRDGAGNSSIAGDLADTITLDTVSPSNPSLASSSHSVSIWSNDNTVDINWTGATDATTGVTGVSYEWSQTAGTVPDNLIDSAGTFGSLTSGVLADATNWYYHLKTRDAAGNWSLAAHFGPFYIDTASPANPLLGSPDHTISTWSADTLVDISWSGAADSASGVSGVSYQWSQSAGTVPDAVQDAAGSSGLVTSALADGNNWYFHLITRDNSGNWSSSAGHMGPFWIDATAPTGTVTINGGTSTTTSLTVSLAISASDAGVDAGIGASEMQLSNDPLCATNPAGANWKAREPYNTTISGWDLSAYGGSATAGAKTVYVRFMDSLGNQSAVFTRSITYDLPVIDRPFLVTPADTLLCNWGPLTFGWTAVPGATGYAIELIGSGGLWPSEANNNTPALNRIGAAILPGGSSFTYNGSTSGLVPGMTYWWRIIAIKNGQLFGVFSNAFSLVVSQPKPALTAPANAAFPARGPLTFTWSTVDGATGYAIELCSANPGDTNNAIPAASRIGAAVLPGGSSTTYPGDTSNLAVGQTYWWRIIAIKNGQLLGFFSAPRSFTVSSLKPVLSAPTPGQVVPKNSPLTFSWNFTPAANGAATGYAIELIRGAGLAPGEQNNRTASVNRIGAAVLPGGASLSYQGNTTGLNPNGVYWWRIIAIKDGQLYGEFSDASSFIISQ